MRITSEFLRETRVKRIFFTVYSLAIVVIEGFSKGTIPGINSFYKGRNKGRIPIFFNGTET